MSEVQVIFVVCVSFISDSLSFCQESLIFAKIQSQVNPFTSNTCAPILRWGLWPSGPVVRALVLRSGDPGFKTRSDHSLNLILVVPGSTSQLHL